MTVPEVVYKNPPIQKASPLPTGQSRQTRVTIEFLIQTLCPIHLGCDEVYDPLSFALDPETSELIVFDPSEFLENLSEPDLKHFSRICIEGTPASLIKIYKFMRNKRPLGKQIGVCRGFLGHYDQTLSIPERDHRKIQQELNGFIINRTAYLPTTDRPYIPGSAVKGSMRTAYLNLLATQRKVNPERGKGRDLEKQLLDGGAFATDPFRLLKVSDFMPIGDIKTKIVYAVNQKKKPNPNADSRPYQILETIEPNSVFIGSITVEQPAPEAGIRNPLDIVKLMGSLKSFYSAEKEIENQVMRNLKIPIIETPSDDPTILRLGRHTGAECVTIRGHRNIYIKTGGHGGKNLPNSTTVWLASESGKPLNRNSLKPFGWATLRPIGADEKAKYLTKESDWRSVAEDQRTLTLQRIQDRMSSLAENRDVAVASKPSVPPPPQVEIWKEAHLSWDPGRGEIVGKLGTDRAATKDKEIVPEALRKKLFDKKKPVNATIHVQDRFTITKIE